MRGGLVALLGGEATITDIVAASKIFVSKARQSASLPYIVISQIDTDEFPTLDGTGALRRMGFVIDCMSASSVEAESLANAVRTFIADYSGPAGTYTIDSVLLNSEESEYVAPVDGSDVGIHIVTLNIDVFYQA